MKALPPHKSVRLAAGALAAILMASSPLAELRADTIDWAGGGPNWNTPGNWVGGAAPANDLTTDIARFNSAVLGNINTAIDLSINGIEFGDGGETAVGAITLNLGWAGRTLKIGSGGLNLHTNAGAVNFSQGIVQLVGDQTFTHNGANNLEFQNRVEAYGTSGLVNLTLQGAGTVRFINAVADATGGATLGMTIDKGTGLVRIQNNANTFSGAIHLLSGVLEANGTESLGTGTMSIGATSGSANAVLRTANAGNIRRAITFNAGSSGTAAIEQTGSGTTYSGAITLNRNVALITKSGGSMTFDGDITGTGNLTFSADGGTGILTFRNGKLNMGGEFINQSTTAVTIQGGVGPNVTRIFHNGNAEPAGVVIENNHLEVNSSGTTLEISANARNPLAFRNGAGTTGTGNLTIKNDTTLVLSTRGVGIQFLDGGGQINNAGQIINRGVGTGTSGSVRLHSGIGSNVTAILQESATSAISVQTGVLTGKLDVNTGGTLLRNTGGAQLALSTSTNAVGYQTGGVGNLVLENNTNIDDAISIISHSTTLGGLNHTGYLINQGTGTGRVLFNANLRENLLGIVQDSATSNLFLNQIRANEMTGTVEVRRGEISLAASHMRSYFVNNEVTVATGARINVIAGLSEVVELGSLNGGGTVRTTGNGSFNVAYNIGAANANGAFDGSFTYDAVGDSNIRIFKKGTGIQEIGGTLTNFTAVTVDEGTYQIRTDHTSGISATGRGPVTVKSDAALAGIGVIRSTSNTVTIQSGGILAPGDRLRSELGTLVIDGGAAGRSMLTMEEGATFSFRISYDADQDHFLSDQLHLWNLTGITEPIFNDNEVVISTLGEVALGNYRLFSFYEDDGYWEAFYGANLQLSFAQAGIEGYLADTFGGIDLVITKITPIPEPSTWAMLLGGMAGMQLLTRRARSRKNLHKKVS